MKTELVKKIFMIDASKWQFIADIAMKSYGVDMSNNIQVISFIESHPDFQLPDLYMQYGNSKDMFVSHHSPIYNNLVHSHDFFEMIYVAKGNVVDNINGDDVVLVENEICIHNPNARHFIKKCDDEDLLINILISKEVFRDFVYYNVFKDKGLEGFFDKHLCANTSQSYIAFHNTTDEINSLVEMLLTEYFDESKNEMLLNTILLLLFGNLLRNYSKSEENDEILNYIRQNLSCATLKQVASYFGYHPKYLSYLIKKKSGCTFKDLLINMRFSRATYFLKYTDLSIEDISYDIGYKNPASFYIKFKQLYNQTPDQYRQKVKSCN